jgi:hypothetical protein
MLRSFTVLLAYLAIACIAALPAIVALKCGRGFFRGIAVVFSVLALLPLLLFFWAHLDWLGWATNAVLDTKLLLFVSVPFGLAWLCTWISVSNKREFDHVREPPAD